MKCNGDYALGFKHAIQGKGRDYTFVDKVTDYELGYHRGSNDPDYFTHILHQPKGECYD